MEQIERNIKAKTNVRNFAENEDEEKKMKDEIKSKTKIQYSQMRYKSILMSV